MFARIGLFDLAEAIDDTCVDAEVVLDGAIAVAGGETDAVEGGADVGRRESEGEVRVEVVIEVDAGGKDWAVRRGPHAEFGG